MRITQNQVTRQYLRNSASNYSDMNKINNRITSKRKFTRASEDLSGASQALVVRRNLEKTEMYLNNLTTAEGIYSNAEKTLTGITDLANTITSKLIYAANGTNGEDENVIISNEIKNLTNEILKQVNIEYADRSVFGGTNNEGVPFVYDEKTGQVTYNGMNVDDGNSKDDFPMQKDIYIDVGLGIEFDENGKVDPQTAMNISLSGVTALGCGKDEDGYSKNLLKICFDAAEALKNGDKEKCMDMVDKIKSSISDVLIQITDLGNKQQAVENNTSRVKTEELSLKESQTNIEGVDLEKEITNYKVAEMAYNATLSMGTKVLPSSIFDYMR